MLVVSNMTICQDFLKFIGVYRNLSKFVNLFSSYLATHTNRTNRITSHQASQLFYRHIWRLKWLLVDGKSVFTVSRLLCCLFFVFWKFTKNLTFIDHFPEGVRWLVALDRHLLCDIISLSNIAAFFWNTFSFLWEIGIVQDVSVALCCFILVWETMPKAFQITHFSFANQLQLQVSIQVLLTWYHIHIRVLKNFFLCKNEKCLLKFRKFIKFKRNLLPSYNLKYLEI